MHRMWGTPVVILPIIIGALVVVKHRQADILKKLPKEVRGSFVEIQKRFNWDH